jgi:uncharacterized protein YdeI (YjbR/CyaY-like superfamily)
VRRRIDDGSYSIRFTPRTARSIWSTVNIKRMGELIAARRVAPAGLAAFARRDEKRSEVYSYERKNAELSPEHVKAMKADAKAWANFNSMPPGYRRIAAHWVTSAKKDETRARRLAELIACSRRGERISMLTSPAARKNQPRAT